MKPGWLRKSGTPLNNRYQRRPSRTVDDGGVRRGELPRARLRALEGGQMKGLHRTIVAAFGFALALAAISAGAHHGSAIS